MSGRLVAQSSSPDLLITKRSSVRRILFVSTCFSTDFSVRFGGVFQRMRMLLEGARAAADRVDVLFFIDPNYMDRLPPAQVRDLLRTAWQIDADVSVSPRGTKRHGPLMHQLRSIVDFATNEEFFKVTGPEQVAAIRAAIHPDTDLVFAHHIQPAVAAIAANVDDLPLVIDVNDIEHRARARAWKQSLPSLGSLVRFLEYPGLLRGEIALINRSRHAFVCSTEDDVYLRRKGARTSAVIPNAVRFPVSRPSRDVAVEPVLLLVGTYGYLPNAEAAKELVDRIFPLVRARVPAARLLVVGEGAERLADGGDPPPGVEYIGFVPDLAPIYGRSAVVCCPIRVGGGTRVKIIEAAAFGMPIVSTTLGAEGLALADGREILLRDAPEAFADGCVALLTDRVAAAALGSAAFDAAKLAYDRVQVVERIAGLLRACVPSATSRAGHAGA